jgi:hypothetical protein
MIPAGLKRWFAFGNGVGIQIDGPRGAESMHISAVRVRPGGARIRGQFTVEDFPHQAAVNWGADYAAFLKKLEMRHTAATVLLPRHEIIVRQLSLPGVSDNDLAAAVQFQLEGLHPYNEDDVYAGWARLPGTSTLLVSIARREVIERYLTLFAEAGVRIGSFSSPAACIYSALRLFGRTPASPILAFEPLSSGGLEIYGESPAKPVFSASFAVEIDRAAQLAAAELRTEGVPEPLPAADLLGTAQPLPYAAALTSACPRLSLPINLLPAGQRQSSSPMAWVPSAALGGLVLLLAGGLAAFPRLSDNLYLKSLQTEIAKAQPGATRAANLERSIADAQKRIALLDEFRRRSQADMDVLAEMTRLLPPPAWLNFLELNARQVMIAGEIDQAAPLLKIIDNSPLFIGSEFNMPPTRIASGDGKSTGESFRIRTNRERLAAEETRP